eukprot:403347862
MSDYCSQCNKLFNLTNRKPILIDDYGCTSCLECINFHLIDNPKREIYCPQDKEVATLPLVLRENRQIIRKLQSLDQLTVLCDEHDGQTANLYCTTCQLAVCNYCKLEQLTHKKHQLVNLKQSHFKIYTDNVLKLIDEYSMENIKSKLIHQSMNESQLKSSQFKIMIERVNRMLNNVVSNEEQQQIDLVFYLEDPLYAPQNRQPQRNVQEEQKIQSYYNPHNIQKMINDSQSQLREEFKQSLSAFEINQNQINNEINESIQLNKITQDKQNKSHEIQVVSNLQTKYQAFDSALESTNSILKNIESNRDQQQNLNNDYSNQLQLLQNQIDQTKIQLLDQINTLKIDIEKGDTMLLEVQSQIITEKTSIEHNNKNTQLLINESQTKIREEFKQALEQFEINSNKKENILIDSSNQRINEIQQTIFQQLQQFKQEINCDLQDRMKEIVKDNYLNLKLQTIDQKFTRLNQQIQEINGNFQIDLKHLRDQQDELNTKTESIKQSTQKEIAIQTNKLLEFQKIIKPQEINPNIAAFDTISQKNTKNEISALTKNSITIPKLDFDNLLHNINDKSVNEKKLIFSQLVELEINKSDQSLLKSTLIKDGVDKKFQLLFRGSTHGFTASQFHKLCDNKGPTICFILSEFGQVLGGYTSIPWTSPPDNWQPQSDPSAFVFSLSKRSIHKQYQNQDKAVRHYKDWMCMFGWNSDIGIDDNCDWNINSACDLGSTYDPPHGYKFQSNEARTYLAGQFTFKVLEIEVYSQL